MLEKAECENGSVIPIWRRVIGSLARFSHSDWRPESELAQLSEGTLFDAFEARAAAQRKNGWTQCQGQIDEIEVRGKEEKMMRE